MAGGQSTKTSGDAGSQGAQEFLTSSVGQKLQGFVVKNTWKIRSNSPGG